MNSRIISTLFMLVGLVVVPTKVPAVTGKLTNKDGRTFEGDLKVLTEDTVRLDVAAGDGSVSYVFKKENLAGIEFLDSEALEDGLDAYEMHQYETAISYLEAIHRGRSPFFKLIPSRQLAEPSLTLGKAYLETQRFADATGVAGVLLGGSFEDASIQAAANDMLLLSFFGLKRWNETEVLAKRWCESHEPFSESALGWWILGEVHLARNEMEKARWVSLQPITFSSQYPKAYLQDCFHVAMASWLEESPEESLRLYREYQERGYEWPAGKHSEVKSQLAVLALSMESPVSEAENPDPVTIEDGEPEKDLNLPLETVRKLTTKKEPSPAP